MSEKKKLQEAIALFEAGRKYSKSGTIKINLNEDGYDVVLSALREKLETPRDWTPCAEGLPEHCSENRVTVLDTRCGARYAANMDYNIHTKKWTNDKANELPSCYSVIAWQPLPAPYRTDDTTGKVREVADDGN